MSFSFCADISIFWHVCAELQSLEQGRVVRKNSVVLKNILVCAENSNFWVFSPYGSEHLRTLERSSFFVAHTVKNKGLAYRCAPRISKLNEGGQDYDAVPKWGGILISTPSKADVHRKPRFLKPERFSFQTFYPPFVWQLCTYTELIRTHTWDACSHEKISEWHNFVL